MRVGEGRERGGRWGGAYVQRLGGPEKAGWDCGASPGREGEREGGRKEGGRREEQPGSGQRSAVLSCLSPPPRSPPPGPEAARGIIESSCPAPCPLGGEGEGEGEPPAWGGRGRGGE